MNFIGNLVWLIFGGLLIAIEYLIASIFLMLTIVGIPFGIQTMKLAGLALWPFGKNVDQTSSASGCLAIIMNVIWILIGGIWISLSHIIIGFLFALTIVGIPFARQHFKLALLSLSPFGRVITES